MGTSSAETEHADHKLKLAVKLTAKTNGFIIGYACQARGGSLPSTARFILVDRESNQGSTSRVIIQFRPDLRHEPQGLRA
jgi:hypothetical protein